jgi:hypothetical protein
MSPEDVKPEWVEKAVDIFADEYLPGEDAPRAMRLALAAVLPEAMAEAWDEGEEAGLENAMYVGWEHLQTPNPYREGSES